MRRILICIAICLNILVSESVAKNGSFVGYSNCLPEELIGMCLGNLNQNSFNWYLDLKCGKFFSGHHNDKSFYDNISVHKAENIFGDRLLEKESRWMSCNVGLITALTRKRVIFLYYGLGYGFYTVIHRYHDRSEILGDHGKYWIEAYHKKYVSKTIGIIRRCKNGIILQFGYQFYPDGIVLGIGI